jgi:DtxR family Mn-dependent transcriptional regulator
MYLMVRESEQISNGRIASKLGVSPAAVTQSLRRMGGLGLLVHHSAGTYELTENGWRMAERIISRHYLLERLLVDTLGAPWDVADEEANHLQISLSGRLEQLLDERLGHPETA